MGYGAEELSNRINVRTASASRGLSVAWLFDNAAKQGTEMGFLVFVLRTNVAFLDTGTFGLMGASMPCYFAQRALKGRDDPKDQKGFRRLNQVNQIRAILTPASEGHP
jgi:hypothetical protein